MKKLLITTLLLTSSISLCSCGSVDTKSDVNEESTINAIEQTEESSSISNNEIELTTEQSTDSTTSVENVRNGSLKSPIKLGDKFNFKFIIPKYSEENSLIYGNATISVTEVTPELITTNISFDSCDSDVAIDIGSDIECGAYFTLVNSDMQEDIPLTDDIYTSSDDKIYDSIYPSGSSTVYITNNNAKYLVLHYNIYSDKDEINMPETSETQTFSNGEDKTLNSYKTWFCLE